MAAFEWIKSLPIKQIRICSSVVVSPSPYLPLLFVIVFWGEINSADVLQNTGS